MSALSADQKHKLARLASRAFHHRAALARGRGEKPDMSYKAIDDFRHAQVIAATGKHGLRCCSQLDYKPVEAHFLGLLGEHGQAFEAHVRAATEPRRQASAVLWRELGQASALGLTRAFVEHIARSKFKCDTNECNEKQLWCLVYDVRRTAATRRKKKAALT